jgi:hypothetical protein
MGKAFDGAIIMKNELESQTLRFAVDVVRIVVTLPRSISGEVIGRQLLKSGTSIGAILCRLLPRQPLPALTGRFCGPEGS